MPAVPGPENAGRGRRIEMSGSRRISDERRDVGEEAASDVLPVRSSVDAPIDPRGARAGVENLLLKRVLGEGDDGAAKVVGSLGERVSVVHADEDRSTLRIAVVAVVTGRKIVVGAGVDPARTVFVEQQGARMMQCIFGWMAQNTSTRPTRSKRTSGTFSFL